MSHILNVKKILLLALLLKVAPGFSCEVKEEFPKLTSLAVAAKDRKSSYVFSGSPQGQNLGLFISKCKGGYLQLTQGINLPSPADYSGMTFLRKDLNKEIRCEAQSGSQASETIDLNKAAANHLKISFQCMGLVVESLKGAKINVLDNKQCKIIKEDTENSKVLLQGDNCVIEANQENYTVTPAVLPSCYENLDELSSTTKEIDMSLSVFFKKSLEENIAHDELSQKPIRLTISEDASRNKATSKSRIGPQNFELFKSSEYAMNVKLGDLRLTGTPDTGIQASAHYFIDTTGNKAGNAYRLPFVMKNELYLVKQNEEPIIIGNWYSGSVVSSQWKGLDGEPSFNKLFQGPPQADLTSGSRQIQKGDKLVLVSKLQSPNSGPKRLASYMANLLIKTQKIKAARAAMTFNAKESLSEIPKFEELQGFETIQEIKGFSDLGLFEKSVLRDWSKQWPVVFREACVNGHCGKLEDMTETFVMETMYEVEKDDFELKVKPVRQIEKWNDQKTLDRSQNIEKQVKCL